MIPLIYFFFSFFFSVKNEFSSADLILIRSVRWSSSHGVAIKLQNLYYIIWTTFLTRKANLRLIIVSEESFITFPNRSRSIVKTNFKMLMLLPVLDALRVFSSSYEMMQRCRYYEEWYKVREEYKTEKWDGGEKENLSAQKDECCGEKWYSRKRHVGWDEVNSSWFSQQCGMVGRGAQCDPTLRHVAPDLVRRRDAATDT